MPAGQNGSIESRAVNAILTPGWDSNSLPRAFWSPGKTKTLLWTHLSSDCCCWLFAGWLVVLFCGCLARPLNLETRGTSQPATNHRLSLHLICMQFIFLSAISIVLAEFIWLLCSAPLCSAQLCSDPLFSLPFATFCCKLHYYYGRLRQELEQHFPSTPTPALISP